MYHFPEGNMTSNRGLNAGDIVKEVRGHPFIIKEGEERGHWDFTEEVLRFEIIEVLLRQYRCRYIDGGDGEPFYWSFWDKQPNYGFWKNNCSPVRYYAQNISLTEENYEHTNF